jgi:hypothetical protein
MSFDDKLKHLFKDISNVCKDMINSRYRYEFKKWIATDATRDIGDLYFSRAESHFRRYLTRYTEAKMQAAGLHLVYALSAHILVTGCDDLEKLQEFTAHYIECQHDDFNNWCRDLRNDYNTTVSDRDDEEYGFRTLDASRPTLLQYPGCP